VPREECIIHVDDLIVEVPGKVPPLSTAITLEEWENEVKLLEEQKLVHILLNIIPILNLFINIKIIINFDNFFFFNNLFNCYSMILILYIYIYIYIYKYE